MIEVRPIRDNTRVWGNCIVCGTSIRKGEHFYRCRLDAGKYQTPELDEAISVVHMRCVEELALMHKAQLTESAWEWLRAAKNTKKNYAQLSEDKKQLLQSVVQLNPSKETVILVQDFVATKNKIGGRLWIRL